MPLRWEILHEQKLVHIVAEGAVRLSAHDHFKSGPLARIQPPNLSDRPAD